jgi:hypothetical protein
MALFIANSYTHSSSYFLIRISVFSSSRHRRSNTVDIMRPNQPQRSITRYPDLKDTDTKFDKKYTAYLNAPASKFDKNKQLLASVAQGNTFAGHVRPQQLSRRRSYFGTLSGLASSQNMKLLLNTPTIEELGRRERTTSTRPSRDRSNISKFCAEEKYTDARSSSVGSNISDRDSLTSQRPQTEASPLWGS